VIGEKKKEERLFYYLRPEELIPQDHILRLIHEHVELSFIREKVKHLYSHTGRPSVAEPQKEIPIIKAEMSST